MWHLSFLSEHVAVHWDILIKVIGLSDFEAAPTSDLSVIPHKNIKLRSQKDGLSCAHESDAQYLRIKYVW